MKTSSPADPPSLSIGFRDPIWALVFIAHLILVGIAAGISCSRFDWDQIRPLSRDTVVMLWTLAGSIVTSVAFSYGWLRFLCLPSIRAKVLPTAMTVYASLMVVTSIAWFCYGNWIAGVCFLGSSCLLLVWYYFIRHRVAFNSVLLEMATATVQQHRAIVAVAIVAQLLSFVWVGIWAMAVIGLNLDETSSRVFVLFLIISFYWTGYVLLTFVHVSVGGVAASWFLQAQADGVVRASVRRAGTTSFGSICLGSLILAVVEALRALANSSSQEDNAVRVIAHCILSLIQFVAEFVTNYAYAYVAIWGHDFCTASKQTWQLLKTSGFDTLVTYNLSSLVVLFSGLVGGAIGALLSGLLALAWQAEAKFALVTACAGGFMTLLCTAEIMQVLTSCITIFFVLWAENPRALARNHPDVHQKLGAAALKLQPQFSGNL